MKFALNYSRPASELVARGEIEIDVYKCADWPDMVADAQRQRPAYVHFPLMAGWHNVDDVGLDNIEHFLEQTGTPYVNTHIAPRATDFDMPLDTHDPAHTERLIEAMLPDITRLTAHFGPEKIILENAPWDPHPTYAIPRPVLEPALIRQMVYETGCGFLLDVAHARISAKYIGMDERDYITDLPVDRLRELHVTGLGWDTEKDFWSDHLPMTPEDWELTEWAMGHIDSGKWPTPWVVALEYGGGGPQFASRSKPEVIKAEASRLYAMAHAGRLE